MADLVLYRHPKVADILLDPADPESVQDAANYSPRKVSDFLGVSSAEFDAIVASGALPLRVATDGKAYISGGDLAKFVAKLKPVAFDEVEVEELETEEVEVEEPAPKPRKKRTPNVSLGDLDEDVPVKPAKPKVEKPAKAVKQEDESEPDDEDNTEECFILAPLHSMAKLVRQLLQEEDEETEKPVKKTEESNPRILGLKIGGDGKRKK